jgi:hypothetical protein
MPTIACRRARASGRRAQNRNINMKTTIVYDQHEYFVETMGLFNNYVLLKMDNHECTTVKASSTWDNVLLYEYFIVINNQRRKVVIMLLKERYLLMNDYLIVISEGKAIYGSDLYQTYKNRYYKHTIANKELLKKNRIVRIVLVEWKKVIGSYIIGLILLLIFQMVKLIDLAILAIGVIIAFSIIGIWEVNNIEKETR